MSSDLGVINSQITRFKENFTGALLGVGSVSIIIGIFILISALKFCGFRKLRITINFLIFGSFVLFIVFGVTLFQISKQVPK